MKQALICISQRRDQQDDLRSDSKCRCSKRRNLFLKWNHPGSSECTVKGRKRKAAKTTKKTTKKNTNTSNKTTTPVEITKPSGEVTYKDGMYTAEAEGFDGPVKVTVTIKDGKITAITNTNTDTKEYFN